MYMTVGLLERKVTWQQALKSVWVSYLGNLAGCLAFAYFMMHLTELTSVDPFKTFIMNVATKKIHQVGVRDAIAFGPMSS